MAILNENIETILFDDYKDSVQKSKEIILGEEIVTVNWYGTNISIRKSLPLTDAEAFYKNAVDTCFTGDGYSPQLFDFIVGALTISSYTNLAVPSDEDDLYSLVFNTDIVNTIKGVIHMPQYSQIIDSIKAKVRHLAAADIKAMETAVSQIGNELEDLNNKLGILDKALNKSIADETVLDFPTIELGEENDNQ